MNLSIFALVGVIMLVLAGASIGYLWQVKNKSQASRMLLWFFLCVSFSSIATILTNTGTIWDWAFAPSQDAFLILGGVFLVRFAYYYPLDNLPSERRLITAVFLLVAIGAVGYALFFMIRYLSSLPLEIEENQAFYLITPLVIVVLVLIFFRRSLHISTGSLISASVPVRSGNAPIQMLLNPKNEPAIALRNYGIALAVGLIPAVVTVSKNSLPAILASFLFNFGVVAAIAALMLVYLNYAPEPTTITAKLVGISLATVLLILGLASVWFIINLSGEQVHSSVMAFISLVLLSSLIIIFLFPLFFRSTLLNPLARLLQGVRVANDGNLDVQVIVKYEDEIGFITHSFNRLIHSLNDATQALKNESSALEEKVAERTEKLRDVNQQLLEENRERKSAEVNLDQQLRFVRALAGCSQALLLPAEDASEQQKVLTLALEHLRVGANASRAYVFRNLEDPDLGTCMSIQAEACANDIQPHINNPANQKFPWSQLPNKLFTELRSGRSCGGPVEVVFADTPDILHAFLNQSEPLLSIQLFPIAVKQKWWGFVGFDDCEKPRLWEERAILMLRTASEMIGNTVQRWEAENDLRETLDSLEERVRERTIEFAQANAELRYEVHSRERFQAELEDRLEIERILAKISARLLSPLELKEIVYETLADLGMIMRSSHVVFISLPNNTTHSIQELIEWNRLDADSVTNDTYSDMTAVYDSICRLLDNQQSIYIEDLPNQNDDIQAKVALIFGNDITSLLLTPLTSDDCVVGILASSDPEPPKSKVLENLQLVEVVAGMLVNLLRREAALNMLEDRVAERTQQLSAFFDMAMLAGEAQEISDIMQPALMKIMEISASEAAVIHLISEQDGSLQPVAQRGLDEQVLTRIQKVKMDSELIGWMKRSSEDIWSSGRSDLPITFELPQFQTEFHIPLRARGKILGILSCYRTAPESNNPYQAFFLNAIGEQLGLAVENYRLRLKLEEAATIQERQRLARELHDAVSQSLYSLTLFARSGRDAYEAGDQGKLLDSLEQVEWNSQAALKEMRLLLYQLRSLALQEGGLLQALQSRFQLVERRLGIQTSVHIDDGLELKSRVEQELFWLVTEALNNALKHAAASQVSVSIQPENGQLVLEVWDNGQGFVPSKEYEGMGLSNMHQRAALLGGCIDISSQPGQGTRVRVEIPQYSDLIREG